jgi:PAS domain S-box-containing protein
MKEIVAKVIRRIQRYYPPFKNWHFWMIQVAAIFIAFLHSAFEGAGFFANMERLYFVPISLLVVPVVYAALNFGFAGSIGTAIWVIILTVPNVVWGHTGLERLGEIFQMGILLTMAIFMGQRVDREIASRTKIESANAALTASEMKYRDLFNSSPVAILVLDKNNSIVDSNPAASDLFNKSGEALKGLPIHLLGLKSGISQPSNLKGNWWEGKVIMAAKTGSEVYLEPISTHSHDNQGQMITQILLRDVTEEHLRQAGLKAYCFYTAWNKEERLHIANYMETIQNLALLCRQLDKIDSTGGNLPLSTVEELKKARKIAENVVIELRDFAKALRPSTLDDLGMVTSIRRLLVDFTERAKINGQLKVNGNERRLSRDAEVSLFRIAQEALWNIERHAKAANVNIVINFGRERIYLEVTDDGQGFNVQNVFGGSPANGHLGLVGMQERAELSGGKLEISSTPGKGTTVVVSIPVAAPNTDLKVKS